MLLKNATVLDYFPCELKANSSPRVEVVDLRVDDERITERGPNLVPDEGEEVQDLTGVLVMPGVVNAHSHLYSSLAVGMPAPKAQLNSFVEILENIWWPLDAGLDAKATFHSAVAGAWDAVRCGTTLIFDHHASFTAIEHSLDEVERGIALVGLRACLCYETTDRGGAERRDQGLAENERYLLKLASSPAPEIAQFRGLVGGHASFTLTDESLALLAKICDRTGVGFHIHLSEGSTDSETSDANGWAPPLERLAQHGLVRAGSIFAHGVDLEPAQLDQIDTAGAWLIHCGRSNMNNGVGRAAIDYFPQRRGIGSDGLDNNLWSELRTTYFRGNEGDRGAITFADAEQFWLGNYRLAREIFDEPFGSLDVGAPADFIVMNKFFKTPMTTENWVGHLLFDFHPWDISTVYVGGKSVFHHGDNPPVSEQELQQTAAQVWKKMNEQTD
ncbi:MAG: cytosine/adenosine deaminase-related metal-dependent hydrolase [Candidatus Krumholzibacteriia bacterium]